MNSRFITSALVLGLAWQQLGWIAHEYCHQQPFANRYAISIGSVIELQNEIDLLSFNCRETNDTIALILANFAQGLSRDWWKDKVRFNI